MDHRHVLRASTNASLIFFVVMTAGVVLWTTDEVLGWDLFPDWLGRYAQLIVIVLSILAVSAVVTSLICSFAVMADSAARRAGLPEIVPSRRNRVLALGGVPSFFLVLFALHQVDVYREGLLRQEHQARVHSRYQQAQRDLRARIRGTVALFSSDTATSLAGGQRPTVSDEEVARLLRAIQASTPHGPTATVMVRAQAPYRYCVIRLGGYSNGPPRWLDRDYFTDLPSPWERDTIASLFGDRQVPVPNDRPGVFLDTTQPSAWAPLRQNGSVVGIVMLRASVDRS